MEEDDSDSPRFAEDEALGKYKLIGDPDAPDTQSFSTDCGDESWSEKLPSIVGEGDLGKKFTVEVNMGQKGTKIYQYDSTLREISMKK